MSEGKVNILHSDFEVEGYKLRNFINLKEEELEMVRSWRNHQNVKKWMYSHHYISKEEHISFVKSLKNSYNSAYWIVQGQKDYIGVLYFNRLSMEQGHAYYGIYANPFERIPGAGRILDKIAIEIAFGLLDLHTLKLEVMEDNVSVINLHRKFGFREEGVLKEFVNREGKWIDVIIMGMINPKHQTTR